MFEVVITKKPAEKAAKTSLLWQRTAFALTSNDLNNIVIIKVLNDLFYSNYGHLFGPASTPNDKTRNTCTYSMSLMCYRSWLVGFRPFHPWWSMKLRLTNLWRTSTKKVAILFFSAPVIIFEDNYHCYYIFKAFLVINNVLEDEWTYICEKQTSRISVCGQ